ncbi:MAG: oligosaccharide flippase family protein [Chthoniobacteraceae bacterium]
MTPRKVSIVRTASSSVVLRMVSLACTLVQVPIVMPYLGEDFFGFWMVLVAIGGFFGLSDLGISSAFQNDVTLADTRGDRARLRSMFLTAQGALFVFAVVGAAILVGVAVTLGKVSFFRDLPPRVAERADFFTIIFVAIVAFNAPLALSSRLAFGLHEGRLANLTAVVAQLLTLGAMTVSARFRAPFAVFLLTTIVPTLLANFVLGIWLFRKLPPNEGKLWAGTEYAKHTVRTGIPFLALGASLPLFFGLGPLLLSSTCGPAVVTVYSLATRALGVLHNLEAGVLGATWPPLTEAIERADFAWVRRCLRRNTLIAGLAFCLPALLFPLLGPSLLALWSGLPASSFSLWIIWPVTLLFCAVLFQGPFYIALSAAGSVGVLAASHFAAAAAVLGAAAVWHQSPHLIPAFIAGAFALFALPLPIAQTRRLLRPVPAR